jgi:hypothetical protein
LGSVETSARATVKKWRLTENDDFVGSGEIQPHTTSLRGNKKNEDLRLVLKQLDILLA